MATVGGRPPMRSPVSSGLVGGRVGQVEGGGGRRGKKEKTGWGWGFGLGGRRVRLGGHLHRGHRPAATTVVVAGGGRWLRGGSEA